MEPRADFSDEKKKKKFHIEDVNLLLERNIERASTVNIDINDCINPTVLTWLRNYDHITCGHTISLYYCLMSCISHLSMESHLFQSDELPRHMNLYSIILGYSGTTKSAAVNVCRKSLEAVYEFLRKNHVGDPNGLNSLIDTFTDAGFLDQLKETPNVLIMQEEIDTALKQMNFFSTNNLTINRQMFCQLYDGFSMRKRTKAYVQRICDARMNICGASTGVLLPPVLHDFLKHVMTDGVVVRCLFLVLGYTCFISNGRTKLDISLPTIAQLLLSVFAMDKHTYNFTEVSEKMINRYVEKMSKKYNFTRSPRITSFLAKQGCLLTRLAALTQIIDNLPLLLQNIYWTRKADNINGLDLNFLKNVASKAKIMFDKEINISVESTRRAIYLHGYLFEQTLTIFDTSEFESVRTHVLSSERHLTTENIIQKILRIPHVILMKETFYLIPGNAKIHRDLGQNAFNKLVDDDLLIQDYFLLTATYRPIKSYAKKIPKNDDERSALEEKLKQYQISIDDYLNISKVSDFDSYRTLSSSGKRFLQNKHYQSVIPTDDEMLFSSSSTSSDDEDQISKSVVNKIERKMKEENTKKKMKLDDMVSKETFLSGNSNSSSDSETDMSTFTHKQTTKCERVPQKYRTQSRIEKEKFKETGCGDTLASTAISEI